MEKTFVGNLKDEEKKYCHDIWIYTCYMSYRLYQQGDSCQV